MDPLHSSTAPCAQRNPTVHAARIFGIGLSRTGTRSLAAALNLLGIKTKWHPSDPTTYAELLSGKFDLSVLQRYQGLTDTPVVPYYPQLDRLYPRSKFILTVREKTSWLKSCEKHWTTFGFTGVEQAGAPFWRVFACFVNCCVYGCHGYNADRFSSVYDAHVRNVRRYFESRPGDLLVMDITQGEGWDKLCPFLGRPAPAEPFPHMETFHSPLLQ